jgi:TPR repeat protein
LRLYVPSFSFGTFKMKIIKTRRRFRHWQVCFAVAAIVAALSAVKAEPSAPPDVKGRGIDQFRIEAESGDAVAQYNLGVCYHNGVGVAPDAKEAIKWFRKAALQGNATAQYHLGLSLVNGNGAPTNAVEGAQWYRKAADQELAQAQFELGICYRDGVGVSKDRKEALVWFRKAANQGFARAQQSLGMAYSQGDGVPQDQAEAFRWFHKAAEQGDPYAQRDLAICYRMGEGVDRDAVEALKWDRKSAEQGHPAAQRDLGLYYASGEGVDKDEAEAMRWFRRAAEQRDRYSQWRLGVMLELRNKVAEAVPLYRQAAEQGLPEAQLCLAGCYLQGRGVEKDLAESYKWVALSQPGGLPMSTNALKVLTQKMTHEEIAEGQRRAQLYHYPTASPATQKPEPGVAANRNQPVPSETAPTPAVAGSGR